MQRESSSSQNRKAGYTHTHSLTHSHTGRLLYPCYSPTAARVIIVKLTLPVVVSINWSSLSEDSSSPEDSSSFSSSSLSIIQYYNVCNKLLANLTLMHHCLIELQMILSSLYVPSSFLLLIFPSNIIKANP